MSATADRSILPATDTVMNLVCVMYWKGLMVFFFHYSEVYEVLKRIIFALTLRKKKEFKSFLIDCNLKLVDKVGIVGICDNTVFN